MNHSMIPRLQGTFFVAFRQDLILLCQQQCTKKKDKSRSSDYCKALILAILDHWTFDNLHNQKSPSIHITLPQWEALMYGMYKRNVIADSLWELCEEGWVERTAFKTGFGGHDHYRYTLKYEIISRLLQTTVKIQSSPGKVQDSIVEDRGNFSDQFGNFTGDISKFTGDNGVFNGASSVATVKIPSKIEEQEEVIENNIDTKIEDSSPTPSVSSNELSQEETDLWERLKAMGVEKAKDTAKVKEHISFLAAKVNDYGDEQMHKFIEYARAAIRGEDKRVWLGNLAKEKLIDSFLRALEAEQSFATMFNPQPPEIASAGDCGALLARIKREHPELDVKPGHNDFGDYVDVRYGEGRNDCYTLWDDVDWDRFKDKKGVAWDKAVVYAEQQRLSIAV